MKINVTKEDLATDNPIQTAVRRQHGLECSVDKRFIQFKDNEKSPRRLPLAVETYQYRIYSGQPVDPFEFEI